MNSVVKFSHTIKILTIFQTINLLFCLILVFISQKAQAADWYDAKWKYRTKITIAGSPNAGINYQIPIKVVYPPSFAEDTVSELSLTGIESSDIDSAGNIYAGKQRQIYKSTDNGKTFTLIYTISAPPKAWNTNAFYNGNEVLLVYVDSRDYVFVSAISTNRLYRSTDGGKTFSHVLNLKRVLWETDGSLIRMTEDQHGHLYAAEYGDCSRNDKGESLTRLWKSTNGGATWLDIKSWDARHLHSVDFNPYNNFLYVVTGEPINKAVSETRKVYRSKDGGSTWKLVATTDDSLYLPVNFINDWVYLGEDKDYTSASTEVSNIKKFKDDGISEPFNPITAWANPEPNTIVWSISKLNNFLILITIPKSYGAITAPPRFMQIYKSSDGTKWELVRKHAVTSSGVNKGIGRTLPFLTYHPDRTGQIFGSFTASSSFCITSMQFLDVIAMNEKSRADFNDVMFTASDGITPLHYWRESYTDSKSAVFWVKISADLSTDQNVYIYYGNSSASSASNGINTFIFFDDFSNNLSKWNITSSAESNVKIVDGAVKIISNGSLNKNGITSIATVSRPAVIEWSSWSPEKSTYHRTYEGYSSQPLTRDSGLLIERVGGTAGLACRYLDGVIAYLTTGAGTIANVPTTQKIVLKPTKGYMLYWDNHMKEDNSDWTGSNQRIVFQSYDNDEYLYVDDVRVRKYAFPEPKAISAANCETNPQTKSE